MQEVFFFLVFRRNEVAIPQIPMVLGALGPFNEDSQFKRSPVYVGLQAID